MTTTNARFTFTITAVGEPKDLAYLYTALQSEIENQCNLILSDEQYSIVSGDLWQDEDEEGDCYEMD